MVQTGQHASPPNSTIRWHSSGRTSTYRNFPRSDGLTVEQSLASLGSSISAVQGVQIPEAMLTDCVRLCCSLCLLENDRSVIEPDVLSKDRDKFEASGDERYVDIEPPPLYFAGWLPNVTPEDIARLSATVASGKVWLSDMFERDTFLARLSCMKNLTAGTVASRESLLLFSNLFGCTSGLRCEAPAVAKPVGSLGQFIDRRNLQLKKLTKEQEDLAFNPNLLVGLKVIRGVVGSGKTIVLANAVAETLLESINRMHRPELLDCTPVTSVPPVLVLCFNRCLVPYLRGLIRECFDKRKPKSDWHLPEGALKVINIDRYAYLLAFRAGVEPDRDRPAETVRRLLDAGCPERRKYAHVFIDEGQDIKLDWYPLIREVCRAESADGRVRRAGGVREGNDPRRREPGSPTGGKAVRRTS